MRHFNNAPIATITATLIAALGVNALRVSLANADSPDTPTPAQLDKICGYGSTTEVIRGGSDPLPVVNYTAINYLFGIGNSANTVKLVLSGKQDGLLQPNDLNGCPGKVIASETLQLVAGTSTTRIPNAAISLVVDNKTMWKRTPPQEERSVSYSFAEDCTESTKPEMQAVQTLTYEQNGYPNYTASGFIPGSKTNLPCSGSDAVENWDSAPKLPAMAELAVY